MRGCLHGLGAKGTWSDVSTRGGRWPPCRYFRFRRGVPVPFYLRRRNLSSSYSRGLNLKGSSVLAPGRKQNNIGQYHSLTRLHGAHRIQGHPALRWGALNHYRLCCFLFALIFSKFVQKSKHCLSLQYRIHIWKISIKVSFVDTCQIWIWFKRCI